MVYISFYVNFISIKKYSIFYFRNILFFLLNNNKVMFEIFFLKVFLI